MKRFISLNMITYGKQIGEADKCRAMVYDFLLNIDFIEAVYGYEYPADDYFLEDGLGSMVVLNKKGLEFLEEHFGVWAFKSSDLKPGNNSILVKEAFEYLQKKLELDEE